MKSLSRALKGAFLTLFIPLFLSAALPQVDANATYEKMQEIMENHVSEKTLSPTLIERTLSNYVEILDPTKTYLLYSDMQKWIEPNSELIQQTLEQIQNADFSLFAEIHETFLKSIPRRKRLENRAQESELPKGVTSKEFRNMDWVDTEEALFTRLLRLRSLQIDAAEKLTDEQRTLSFQRIDKRRAKIEEDLLVEGDERTQLILSNVLKAVASSLDSQTAYFTPDEAEQFMINVQQRLFGIGAQLRDDLNGFTVVRVVPGGPAKTSGELIPKDRIIAVDNVPVVGMEITDAVSLIRGEENSEVLLTIVRPSENQEDEDETLNITITRGEVVLKEARIDSSTEPFGDGVIGYIRLFSFYQDPDSSSTHDLAQEIKKLKQEHNLRGLILDLRTNSGGMLSQAVGVTGLFVTKGVIVSIKNDKEQVQHLRDLDSKTSWDGPLIVLVNPISASASEIVAQTLQDYGRALVVGDEKTFGKGTFQSFSLAANQDGTVNPEGEYKVTRGRYYTVSGRSPQLTGVSSDIIVPGVFCQSEIGEQHTKYPLESDTIKENYHDDLSDVPSAQREKIRKLYKFDLQPRLSLYANYIEQLQKNSQLRIEKDKNYQAFLAEIEKAELDEEEEENFGQNDLQLAETLNIMKDLIILLM